MDEILIADLKKNIKKEKEDQIIDLLIHHNEIKTLGEYDEIRFLIKQAIRSGDLALLRILLNETIEEDGILYKINKIMKTASIISIERESDCFIFPRSIKYESEDYAITSIIKAKFHEEHSISFVDNSQIQTIYPDSFYFSDIKELHIPESLIELKNGWCHSTPKLTKIKISPLNKNFTYFDKKLLLGKSDPKSDNFDILLFARRDIKKAVIPSNIKIISPFAFENCVSLETIEIPSNSDLQNIGEFAFCETLIDKIFIPENLTELTKGWCNTTLNLTKIEISPLNKNFTYFDEKFLLGKSDQKSDNFDVLLFARRDIEEAVIPSNIKIISPFAFHRCKRLKSIEIPEDSKLQTLCEESFDGSGIVEIYFPSSVKTIGKFSFFDCKNLRYIEFSEDSQIEIIDEFSFSQTDIKEIHIPPNVSKICKNAFRYCKRLEFIEIPENSKLKSIGKNAFAETVIEELYFPESLIELKDGWCYSTPNLTKFEISPLNKNFTYFDDKYLLGKSDPKSDNFDVLLFARRDIEEAVIPSNIKIISPSAFEKCISIETIEIPSNSELQIIGEKAFNNSSICKIYIPSNVSKICKNAFEYCDNLQTVEFDKNSKLKIIEKNAFNSTMIEQICIPSSVSIIGVGAFSFCSNLSNFIFEENSNLRIIENAFYNISEIEKICIPSNVSIISKNAFRACTCLKVVQFEENSKLEIISSFAFAETAIESICIPSTVTEINKGAFNGCNKLQFIKIPKNSKLKSIGTDVVASTKIEKIYFPYNLTRLHNKWFNLAPNLTIVEISPSNKNFIYLDEKFLLGKSDPKSDNFDVLLFARRDIEHAIIPSNIKIISQSAFENCNL